MLRVLFREAERVLDALSAHGVRIWVTGDWGVAALAGTQSRDHRDLDLAVDADDLIVCLQTLEGVGYQRETDWLPVRVEYAAPCRGWVDVHPVAFDEAGHGRQPDLDGGWFDYPPSVSIGALHGRPVPCLSREQQHAFHSGYQPRPQDVHDLAQLDGLGE